MSGSDKCEDKIMGGEVLWDLQARILERAYIEIKNDDDGLGERNSEWEQK